MLLNTAYGQMVAGLLLSSCVKLASEARVWGGCQASIYDAYWVLILTNKETTDWLLNYSDCAKAIFCLVGLHPFSLMTTAR